jgi:hypothetical protein
MSKQLAISSAFSVLMMASFVLFGANALQRPLDSGGGSGMFGVEASAVLPL